MTDKNIYILLQKDDRRVIVMKNGTQQVGSLQMPYRILSVQPSGNPNEYMVTQKDNRGKSWVSIVTINNGMPSIKRTQFI